MKPNCRGTPVLALVLMTCLASLCRAENWPQWRGPFHNGSTTEKPLPESLAKENIVWTAAMPGPGAATPIVWNDRVFVSAVDRQTKDLLAVCVSVKDGSVLWQKPAGKDRTAPSNDMASPSAVTDGNTVFFYYGTGDLAAFDYDGRCLWSRGIEKDYGNLACKFGYSSSPLLYGGKLYILVLRRPKVYRAPPADKPLDSFLLAIDPKTGKDLWKHVRPTDAVDEDFESYNTPVPYEGKDRKEIIIHGGGYVTGHDPDTGKEFWRYGYNPRKERYWRLVAGPATGNGLIFGYTPRRNSPIFAIKAGGTGKLGPECLAWTIPEPSPDVCCPLYYQDMLYILNGDRKTIACVDPNTGKAKWQGSLVLEGTGVEPKRADPTFFASVSPGGDPVFRASATAADGKIYCIDEQGNVIVLAAGDAFRVLAHFIISGEGPCRASIAIANGKLFIRGAKNLYCLSVAGKKSPSGSAQP